MNLNLDNLVADAAHQDNVSTAITRMAASFAKPDPLPPAQGLSFVCQNSEYRAVANVAPGDYVLLPTLVNGPPPTVAQLTIDFQLVILRVMAASAAYLTLLRITLLESNASAATAGANALATYGTNNTTLYYTIPPAVDGAAGPQLLVAIMSLRDQIRNNDPHAAPPLAPAMAIQPAVPAVPGGPNMVQQLVDGQHNMLMASKITVPKQLAWDRLQRLERTFTAGRFNITLLKFMFGLPEGQPPSAGYFHYVHFTQAFKKIFFDLAAHLPALTVTISDTKLEQLTLLLLSSTTVQFSDFAMPSEIPISWHNIKTIINRVCDLLAIVFGADLPMAILNATEQLINLNTYRDAPGLTTADVFKLLERRLFLLDCAPGLDISLPPGDKTLPEKLSAYLNFLSTDTDLKRLIYSHDSEIDSSQPKAVQQAPKRQRQTKQAAPVSAPVTRSATLSDKNKADLKEWFMKLYNAIPVLEGKLPCLYFFTNKAPCFKHATCQKHTHKVPHTKDPVLDIHKDAIMAWLKLDPLGRF